MPERSSGRAHGLRGRAWGLGTVRKAAHSWQKFSMFGGYNTKGSRDRCCVYVLCCVICLCDYFCCFWGLMFVCLYVLCVCTYCVFVYLCICVFMYLCICVFVYLCICVFVYLCICVFLYLCYCLFAYCMTMVFLLCFFAYVLSRERFSIHFFSFFLFCQTKSKITK